MISPSEFFLAHLAPPDENGCINWLGSTNPSGGGRFWTGGRAGSFHRSNRFAYEHFIGPIPDGDQVIPSCGNASREALHVARRPHARSSITALTKLRDPAWLAHAYSENTIGALARSLDTNTSIVQYWLTKHGIARRSFGEALRMRSAARA